MKEGIPMKNRLLALLLIVLMMLCAACPAYADAPAWLSVAGTSQYVLAANADGARFLLGEELPMTIPPNRNLRLSVLDKTTGASRALYFAEDPNLELLAHSMLYLNAKVQDEATRTALIEKNGGAAAVVMRAGWCGWPRLAGTGGNYMLLYSAAMSCYARVDTRTGETLYLDASAACVGPGGSVLFRSRDMSGMWLLKPDTAKAEAFPLATAKGGVIVPFSMCLLSDGSVWLIEYVTRAEQPQVEGKNVLVRDVFFVHYGADGRELRRVEAGGLARVPDTLFFSEQTGAGVAYSPQYAMCSPMWTFAGGDDTAKALLVKSLTPPALYRAERDAAVDELGYPLSEVRALVPLGIAADGARLLLYDTESAHLLALDLQTLEADILMTNVQLEALYDEKEAEHRFLMHLTMLSWNGGDLLCGRSNPGGCALQIPYTGMFSK
jgi:hypothetical protein